MFFQTLESLSFVHLGKRSIPYDVGKHYCGKLPLGLERHSALHIVQENKTFCGRRRDSLNFAFILPDAIDDRCIQNSANQGLEDFLDPQRLFLKGSRSLMDNSSELAYFSFKYVIVFMNARKREMRNLRKPRSRAEPADSFDDFERRPSQRLMVLGNTVSCENCKKELASFYCPCGSFLCAFDVIAHKCHLTLRRTYAEDLLKALR